MFLEILIFQKFSLKDLIIRKKSSKIVAPSGNRTRAASLTGEYATSLLKTSCLANCKTRWILW